MTKKFLLSFLLILSSLFFFSSCEELFFEAQITKAEFGDDFKTIYVYYDQAPSNYRVRADVYVNNHSDSDYKFSIDESYYNAFKDEKKATIKLNNEVPVNSKVVIKPAKDNDQLGGEQTLYRLDEKPSL